MDENPNVLQNVTQPKFPPLTIFMCPRASIHLQGTGNGTSPMNHSPASKKGWPHQNNGLVIIPPNIILNVSNDHKTKAILMALTCFPGQFIEAKTNAETKCNRCKKTTIVLSVSRNARASAQLDVAQIGRK